MDHRIGQHLLISGTFHQVFPLSTWLPEKDRCNFVLCRHQLNKMFYLDTGVDDHRHDHQQHDQDHLSPGGDAGTDLLPPSGRSKPIGPGRQGSKKFISNIWLQRQCQAEQHSTLPPTLATFLASPSCSAWKECRSTTRYHSKE